MGEVVEVGGEHGFVRCADPMRMHLRGAGNTLALAGVFFCGWVYVESLRDPAKAMRAVGPITAWVCLNQSKLLVLASDVALGGHPFGRLAPGGYA